MRFRRRAGKRTEAWDILDERELLCTTRGLRVLCQTVRLPDGRTIGDYYQLAIPDFVVVYALTGRGSVICLRQYKHAPRRVALTLPGGLIDRGEPAEKAAQRELLEETGYACSSWRALGRLVLHGNQRIAEAHVFLATGGLKIAEPNSGDLEEMAVELLPPDGLLAAVSAGEFPIVSHVAAIGLAQAAAASGSLPGQRARR